MRGRLKPKEACHRALCIISAANLPPFCFFPHRCKKCMQSKQFLFSSLPFIVYFLSPTNESSGLWLSNSPEAGLVTCPVNTCQHFVVHSVLIFFFLSLTSPIKFPSISSDSPPFYLHFCIQEFYYRVRAFVSLVCVVFHAGRVPAWRVGMERFFFFLLSLQYGGPGKERYCVRTCLCEAFPNSLRNLSANKASFFWLTSRQSVHECYTTHKWLMGVRAKVSSIRTCTYNVARQSF